MSRYVLKINDSTYVKHIHWIMGEIPHEIKISDLQSAMIVTEQYLNYIVRSDGTNGGKGKSRGDFILKYYPHVKIVPVKLVIDE